LIFLCVGSREYQFDRLLKEIDNLLKENKIDEEVFAQIGQSNYIPTHYQYVRYMSPDDFRRKQIDADLIISHGGTGALVAALKLGKKVIAVPRLVKYQEHIDDHQIQVCDMLEKQQYLKVVYEMSDLYGMMQQVKKQKAVKKYSNPSNILSIIDEYIARTQKLRQE
jgi:UDP-N-acetylglucosamine transferase subunit ALG13